MDSRFFVVCGFSLTSSIDQDCYNLIAQVNYREKFSNLFLNNQIDIQTEDMNGDDEFGNPNYLWSERQIIGQGGFGKVFKVLNQKTGEFVAIKQLDMASFDEDYKKQALLNEIGIQKQLASSPYTVKYYDHFIGKKFTYIISELCDGDLKKQMEENGGKLSEVVSAEIFREIIKGFKLLTDKGYIHRDVKPQNILIKNGVHKIADFGFSRKADIHGGSKIKETCGTPLYMAPQLLMNQQYTSKCDIWSLGLMLYEMIFGFGPWPQRHPEAYKLSILSQPVSFPYGSSICQNTKDFILGCLVIEQARRMSWNQLFNHPFIAKKEMGAKIKSIPVNKQSIGIFQRVQESSRRKMINLRGLFQGSSKDKQMGKKQFHILISDIDPTITTYETQQIFKAADLTQDGSVDTNEFQRMFCDVDYRPAEDVASRRIQELIAMAKARGLNIRSFFEMFDSNQSGTIDKGQFVNFIKQIAPQISLAIIKQMWDKFDRDNSGDVSANEFIEQLTRGVPNQQSKIGPNRERAKRNLSCMKQHLKNIGISSKQMISKGDRKKTGTLTIEQFGPMIQEINYVITKEEIREMFQLIDTNHNSSLELDELNVFLQ